MKPRKSLRGTRGNWEMGNGNGAMGTNRSVSLVVSVFCAWAGVLSM